MSKIIRVRTFYPADPVGVVPGGIDTFMRGLIKWAPDELEFSLVGMTTEPVVRPVGQWTTCDLGRRQFKMLPLLAVEDAGGRSRIPLSLRFTSLLYRNRAAVAADFDVFEFHRIEPVLPFRSDRRPKNAFFHQDMSVIGSKKSDIFWRHLPAAYFYLERMLFSSLGSAYCVREEGAKILRQRYPDLAPHIQFIPTWVDTEIFWPASNEEGRRNARAELRSSLGLSENAKVIITVGRLDTQKNPQLLLLAFAQLHRAHPDAALVFVGDGVLRAALLEQVKVLGIADKVRFAGLLAPARIAEVLRGSDLFALSSNYEGMPMALLEALGCGVPVVTTDVGEVRRVVSNGSNGYIVVRPDPDDFCAAMHQVLNNLDSFAGEPCVKSIQLFQPAVVLEKIYENYIRLASY